MHPDVTRLSPRNNRAPIQLLSHSHLISLSTLGGVGYYSTLKFRLHRVDIAYFQPGVYGGRIDVAVSSPFRREKPQRSLHFTTIG